MRNFIRTLLYLILFLLVSYWHITCINRFIVSYCVFIMYAFCFTFNYISCIVTADMAVIFYHMLCFSFVHKRKYISVPPARWVHNSESKRSNETITKNTYTSFDLFYVSYVMLSYTATRAYNTNVGPYLRYRLCYFTNTYNEIQRERFFSSPFFVVFVVVMLTNASCCRYYNEGKYHQRELVVPVFQTQHISLTTTLL